MVPSRISSRAFVLKLVRIVANLVSKLRAEVGTLMSVPLLLATRGVQDECRRRPSPLGMERIRFPVSSRIGYVFGPLLFVGGTCWSSWTLSACLSLSLWCSFLVLGPAVTGARFPRLRLLQGP